LKFKVGLIFKLILFKKLNIIDNYYKMGMGIGDWGLGIMDYAT